MSALLSRSLFLCQRGLVNSGGLLRHQRHHRHLSLSSLNRGGSNTVNESFEALKKRGAVKVSRGVDVGGIDEEETLNMAALASVTGKAAARSSDEDFQLYPDESTMFQTFNGIPLQRSPLRDHLLLQKQHQMPSQRQRRNVLVWTTPTDYGFKNATKRTETANTTLGINLGQSCRNLGIKF